MNLDSNIYYFGNKNRLSHYIADPHALLKLSWKNVFKLTSNDIIISPRPRSTLLEYLFLCSKPDKRPALLQLADGFVFFANSNKKQNRRYGGLYRNVIADVLIINQPICEVDDVVSEIDRIETMITYKINNSSKLIEDPCFVLVASNDPFLDRGVTSCIDEYVEAYRKIKLLFGDDVKVYLSSVNPKLTKPLLGLCKDLKNIGPLSGAELCLDNSVFVGSPGTVIHERFISGQPTYLLSGYADGVKSGKFSLFHELINREKIGSQPIFKYKSPKYVVKRNKLTRSDILEVSIKKRRSAITFLSFFRELQLHVLIHELKMLTFK
tara:strand:- start:5501 stop:6469 length:969 start_codon:yes stop_codon:yes gene_type:complete